MAWSQRSPFLYVNDQAPIGLQYNQTTLVWETIFLDENQNKFVPLSDLFSNPVAPLPVPTNGTDLTLTGFLSAGGRVQAGTHFRAPNDTNPATPVYSITGATDKGIYPTTNGIGFAVGGSRVGEFQSWGGGFTGNVIQVVRTVGTTDYTGTLFTITDLNTTFTPRYSNSLIIIEAEAYFAGSASGTIAGGGLYLKINGITKKYAFDYAQTTIAWSSNIIVSYSEILSSSSPLTLSVEFSIASGSGSHTVFGSSDKAHYLTVMEIQR